MFTGIIESIAEVCAIQNEGTNIRLLLKCSFTSELKIDQSLAHNGVCLTVVNINGSNYEVVAIHETLIRTNLGKLKTGDKVNLERCMQMNGRLDGHIVQGHVDTTAKVEKIITENGSWRIYFSYSPSLSHVTVEKGSVCINGVSLTVVDSGRNDPGIRKGGSSTTIGWIDGACARWPMVSGRLERKNRSAYSIARR